MADVASVLSRYSVAAVAVDSNHCSTVGRWEQDLVRKPPLLLLVSLFIIDFLNEIMSITARNVMRGVGCCPTFIVFIYIPELEKLKKQAL